MESRNLKFNMFHIDRSSATTAMLFLMLSGTALFAAKSDKSRAFENGGLDENRIASQVRHELLQLPYYGVFDDLAFRVDGDTVTLLGAVVNPVLKSDAERAVKRIEGVGHVKNEIEVLPLSPNDDQIRMAEYKAIYGDPVLSTRYGYRALPSIHIIVKNGNVTLVGVVANEADKNLVGIRANSVPGVFSVANNLQVEGA
jgi:hyperosmotically inducible periplasmic protein